MERGENVQTTMTHGKTEVSEVFGAGWKREQQTTINSTTYLPCGGGRQLRQMSQWTLKSTIVDSLGVFKVVENEKK
jgi:hypothetical protein